jgi:hypothetical protein
MYERTHQGNIAPDNLPASIPVAAGTGKLRMPPDNVSNIRICVYGIQR